MLHQQIEKMEKTNSDKNNRFSKKCPKFLDSRSESKIKHGSNMTSHTPLYTRVFNKAEDFVSGDYILLLFTGWVVPDWHAECIGAM